MRQILTRIDVLNIRLLLLFFFAGLGNSANADWDLAATAQLSNDWLYQGVSETSGRPNIGLNFELQETEQPWFLGFEAHRSKATSRSERHESFSVYLGLDVQLGDKWFAGAAIKQVEYPDSVQDWDYTEVSVSFTHLDGFSGKVDYSEDYYHRGTAAAFYSVQYGKPFAERLYWQLGVTKAEFEDSRWPDYISPSLTVGYQLGLMNLNLGLHYNNESDENLFGTELDTSTATFGIVYRLR